eukprot:Clim_evm10s201 gene=Clim_evmTU10s201
MTGILTPEQREQFKKDGYIVIPSFYTSEEVQAMRDRMAQLVAGFDPVKDGHPGTAFETKANTQGKDAYFMESADKIRYFFEAKADLKQTNDTDHEKDKDLNLKVNKVGHGLHIHDDVFRRMTQHHAKVRQLITQDLRYDRARVPQSMYIFKQPKIGGAVLPHRDATFLATDPMTLVGLWTPLEDATTENGCLSFWPGSQELLSRKQWKRRENVVHPEADRGSSPNTDNHASDQRGDDEPVMEFEGDDPYEPITNENERESEYVIAEMKAGDLAIIHGLVLHQSKDNTSAKSRHAYTFHIYDEGRSLWSPYNWLNGFRPASEVEERCVAGYPVIEPFEAV